MTRAGPGFVMGRRQDVDDGRQCVVGSRWDDVPFELVCEVACAGAAAEAGHVEGGAAAARHGDQWCGGRGIMIGEQKEGVGDAGRKLNSMCEESTFGLA